MRHIKFLRFASRFSGLGVFGQALLVANISGCSGSSAAPGLGAGGVTNSGGAVSNGGSALGGAVANGGGVAQGGSSNGTVSNGGVTTNSGGTQAAGGSVGPSGGSNAQGGASTVGGTSSATGGQANAGGTTGTATGGAKATGGVTSAGGNTATGGVTSTGGAKATGGAVNVGGTSTGGAANTGGKAAGGAANTGGKAAGGAATGGAATGGAATGGAATGGAATGGAATGDRCDVGVYNSGTPPQALTLSGSLGTHDPSAIESNGTYYLFATGLGAKTSTNVTTWANAAQPFGAPAWAQTSVPGVTNLWAADISYFGGRYHLYYSASTFGSNRSCIGHATKTALNSGSWADQGSAVICSNVTTTGDNWNAIDPAVVLDTAGTPWMSFGSFWSGIKIIQLDQNGARVGTTVTAIASRPSNGGALEGPYIVRRCGYYYLFTSWDRCCQGASSTYNIRVARSTSVTGPYTDKAGTASLSGGGTLIAQTGGSWVGPGGQSVFIAGTKAYLIYHAYASNNGTATLRIADLVWDSSGWPIAVGP